MSISNVMRLICSALTAQSHQMLLMLTFETFAAETEEIKHDCNWLSHGLAETVPWLQRT